MGLLALTGPGTLTMLGLLVGSVALLGLWVQNRRRAVAGIVQRSIGLGGHHALHVVELDGRRLLVGTGPAAAPHLLTELRPAPAVGPMPSTEPDDD